MPALVDLTNHTFGRLIVKYRDENCGSPRAHWICQCACGNVVSVSGNSLSTGKTRSCKCLRREVSARSMQRNRRLSPTILPHRYGYRNCGVYAIRCVVTGEFYIGSSKNLTRRWCEHRKKLNNNTSWHPPLQAAWNLYGRHAHEFQPLLYCALKDLKFYEDLCVRQFAPAFNIQRVIRTDDERLQACNEAVARYRSRLWEAA